MSGESKAVNVCSVSISGAAFNDIAELERKELKGKSWNIAGFVSCPRNPESEKRKEKEKPIKDEEEMSNKTDFH